MNYDIKDIKLAAQGRDKVEWAEEALRLAEEQQERLGDPDAGGYYAAGADPRLLFRAKPAFDGAVASGNGIAALNAVELFRLTEDGVWAARADTTLRAFAEGMAQVPLAHVTMVRALERFRALERPAASAAARPGGVAGGDPATATSTAAHETPASAAASLEEEAYDAVEVDGRLGRGEDEDWKPFRVELAVQRGWHTNANPAPDGLVPTTISGVHRTT